LELAFLYPWAIVLTFNGVWIPFWNLFFFLKRNNFT
jgi:NADH:ubiquinone oxidoreductase subunit 3 (subunit A)